MNCQINMLEATTIFKMAAVVFLLMMMTSERQQTGATPLDDYVNAPDAHYNWTVLPWQNRGPDFTVYAINMTSQKWLTEKETNQPIWWHYLYVVIPDNITRPKASSLFISQGRNTESYIPKGDDAFLSFITLLAVSTGSVAANLRQIPNQPIVFKADPDQLNRTEDAVIAWTWYEFIAKNGSPEWLIRLPMTKAAVRAMDTITAFTKTVRPDVTVSKYVVMGASKRGWTTWTTAAVDKRVVGIVPIVMDLLSFVKSMHHHYQSLGGWTFAFKDYYAVNTTMLLDSANTARMAEIVDPFSYRQRLTMPKYVISTGGDEFFLPDDSYYYLADMTGDIYLRSIPNAEHSLIFHYTDIFFGLRTFYLSVMDGSRRPKMTWTKTWTDTGAKLTMTTDTKPLEVIVHYAKTIDGNKKRDFRLLCIDPYDPDKAMAHPVLWEKKTANVTGDNQFSATFENPESGWIAFHIQAIFAGPEGGDFEFTTENLITPNTLPHPPCVGEACYGTLV